MSTPSLSVWGNFALTQTDDEHPIAHRVHIAFIAPTPAHVERFGQAGPAAGFADDGPAGPLPNYADAYHVAFLKDRVGNSFEAVHRDGKRPTGNIDHVAIRVKDVDASTAFYSTIGPVAGLTIRRQTADPRRLLGRRRRRTPVPRGRDRGRIPQQRRAGRAPSLPPGLLRRIRA